MVTSRVVWGSAAGLALVAPLAWALSRGPDAPPPEPERGTRELASGDLSAELERLRATLRDERERNLELQGDVEWLRAQLAALGSAAAPPTAMPETLDEAGAEAADAGPHSAQGEEKLWFDAKALKTTGVPLHDVERLREIFDASEMALIELENQARREGWYRSQRYSQTLRDMRIGLREEIGDEAFDQLLYATGRTNRVVIEEVLRDSPGARAGIQSGDVVVSYDGRRVFRAGELKNATTEGEIGDRVTIDVLRDGEAIRLYAQRGPIGVKLRPAQLAPEVR